MTNDGKDRPVARRQAGRCSLREFTDGLVACTSEEATSVLTLTSRPVQRVKAVCGHTEQFKRLERIPACCNTETA